MKLIEVFSNNLKKYRLEHKLTQEQLAELVDIHPKYLSELERARKQPNFDIIQRLSKTLNVKPHNFFEHNKNIVDNHEKMKNIIDNLSENKIELAYEILKVINNQ
ncbi:MAG: helix-turn-helix domain-containing protein [Candidatus Muiribacteriaceae bacterium]